MKTLLNCDDVFESLTRGPNYEGTDSSMEQHLEACLECRQLAQALRPAMHLIHEALPDDLRSGLPVFLAADDTAVASIMEKTSPLPSRQHSMPWRRTSLGVGLAAASAIALLLVLMPTADKPVGVAAVNAALRSLELPAGCIRLMTTADVVHSPIPSTGNCEDCHEHKQIATDSLRHRCCTECHASSGSSHQETVQDLNRLVTACITCH